jgi:WD40 repeat protein
MAPEAVSPACVQCGTHAVSDPEVEGLCPACLLRLAVDEPGLIDHVLEPEAESTAAFRHGALSPGEVHGQRYRIRSLLGRGGMGEVWRAYDLKLRVDVALKALRQELVQGDRALEALRQEVRVAREVVSANVCRVFDLVELGGLELVSMEYIDGITLLDILRMRAPLDLTEAREIASQFLAGLEAIHEAGLVHRDIKPENIMMTRSGRVVVMDFGIAKGLAEKAGTVSGTAAYMAPEQARGDRVDARADIFSAGVVLAEMIAPGGVGGPEERRKLWQALHHEPSRVPDTPWAPVLRTALDRAAERRYATASALARALEEVTLRVEGAEDVRPYPGLASFSEEDREYFFGRELEVEEMWKKLQRPRLLGLIGPSGAGKSSFLRAGLLAVKPSNWRAVVAVPGTRPFLALARKLAAEMKGDEEAVQDLLQFEDLDVAVSVGKRWRLQHDHVLVVVDQFEELFTQNPPEVQKVFCDLLGRLTLEADVHVLVSMRDDFLFHCSGQPALAPMFSELTPLRPPSGTALRRAVVQPALKCGYRFEDDSLIDEIVGEVGSGRGALPMLAFAVARLWGLRDRDRGLLTRESYEHIGGVGGALAQHAEATLEKIGQERVPVVRELFRNLVTAQGTRASRDRGELLSVFADTGQAGEVLDMLIDARLLTSFEVTLGENEKAGSQRIEIVHESLLTAWPRLVRWQTQDADSAQLRDQVRQGAQMWVERGRPADLLWTGTSFREYELWRERYPGGLSDTEEQFASAMKAKARRRKRQRRLAIGLMLAAALSVATMTLILWLRSERLRERAEVEALRAEASKLLTLGRMKLDESPTAALAYATKSLELADTRQARLFVLEILWRGPVARIAPASAVRLAFSPDGEWLATWGEQQETLLLSADGGSARPLEPAPDEAWEGLLAFSPSGDSLLRLALRRAPGGRRTSLLDRFTIPAGRRLSPIEWDRKVLAKLVPAGLVTFAHPDPSRNDLEIDLWPTAQLAGEPGLPKRLALAEGERTKWTRPFDVDPALTRFARTRGREVLVRSLGPDGAATERRIATSDDELSWLSFSPDGSRLAALEASDQVPLWSLETGEKTVLAGGATAEVYSEPLFGAGGSLLAGFSRGEGTTFLWDLGVPLDGKPLVLPRRDREAFVPAFHPGGEWIATPHLVETAFWPTRSPHVRVLRPEEEYTWLAGVTFSPDSRWLVSCAGWTPPHLWPLVPGVGRDHALSGPVCLVPSFDSSGEELLVSSYDAPIAVLPVRGGEPRTLEKLAGGETLAVTFDAEGRLAAAAAISGGAEDRILRVWDLESGESRVLDLFDGCQAPAEPKAMDCGVFHLRFAPDGSLYSAVDQGIRRWDLGTGQAEWLLHAPGQYANGLDLSENGRFLVALVGEPWRAGELLWFDLVEGTHRALQGWGTPEGSLDLDPSGRILVASDASGTIRVGSPEGGEQHLLVGHQLSPTSVALSPDARWIASSSMKEIRVWPMPDLARPPLHTLDREELVPRLRSFTNLRVVADPEASDGWRQELDPFPGWREVPKWQ